MSNTFFAITNETTHESTKMKDNWVWICKDNEELIYDVLVVPVAAKRKPLAKLALRTGMLAFNAYYYLKGMGFV